MLWLGRFLWLLIYAQELVLHSLGMPHFEARNYDPMTIQHMCDGACAALRTRVRRT